MPPLKAYGENSPENTFLGLKGNWEDFAMLPGRGATFPGGVFGVWNTIPMLLFF